MIKFLTNSQMRSADEYTINTVGIPSEELMRRAGVAIADEVEGVAKQFNYKNILVVCGNGNNGGDGYVCANQLIDRGFSVKVYAFNGKLSADCQREKDKYNGEYTQTIEGDLIVDCIFGTGLSRNIEGDYKSVIEQINSSGAYVVSADIPSGINGDNGRVMGVAVEANLTVAVAEYKVGHVLGDGIDYCGQVVKKDIGIIASGEFAYAMEGENIKVFYPKRKRNSNKGTYGSANIVAGCAKYRGAAVLSTEAALRSGCGYVKLSTVKEVKDSLICHFPQAIYLDEPDLTSRAIAIGMGCGKSRELYDKICYLLKNYEGLLIIDADGLNVLSEYGVDVLDDKKCEVLITPHVKEFSRLTGKSVEEILNSPIDIAQAFARQHNITVLLKNATSIICDKDRVVLNLRGDTSLAKGGSGDMLAGLICGNTARGLGLFDATVVSAYVMGVASENCTLALSDYCVTAKEILKELPKVVKSLTNNA